MNIASIFKSNSTPKASTKVDRGSKEFERIDADYGTILDGYQQVNDKLATIDQDDVTDFLGSENGGTCQECDQ